MANPIQPLIICLTPVKNEAWILDRFLQCASLWADHIIIADQMSTDTSRDIALRYDKVLLINNQSITFNESERQKLLLDTARQIPSPNRRKLLIALDADEFLSANYVESEEWQEICQADEGTIIRFDFLNIHPTGKQYWLGGKRMPWGFVDDNRSEHTGSIIHSWRIPRLETAPTIYCKTIKVLHYQFTDWARMQSKHRWYQCYEILNRPHLHPIMIFRIYHHMYSVAPKKQQPLLPIWFNNYEKAGIDMFSIKKGNTYYWDAQVENYFEQYGTKRFASLNIWQKASIKFPDPRNLGWKSLHRYLFWSQIYFVRPFPIGTIFRYFDKILKWLF